MVFFLTYGVAAQMSSGMLTDAYFVAFVAMFFTAYSYGQMAKAYPLSGSAYSFTQKSINPHLGFVVGWALLLDYLLTPMITYLTIGLYLNAQFPAIPVWVGIVVPNLLVTILTIRGVRLSANTSNVFVLFGMVFIVLFCILSIKAAVGGTGIGHLLSTQPFVHAHVPFSAIMSGASLLCFSFLGFDSVTTLSEETVNPARNIPRAIIWIMVISGIAYLIVSYFAQIVHPSFAFKDPNTAANELIQVLGGAFLGALLTTAMILTSFSSATSSVTSISRILYAMGRDTVLPAKVFAYVHPKYRTPVVSIVLVGIISLSAVIFNLTTAASFINFGALVAFTFVNLSVIAHYFIRNGKRTGSDTFRYLVLPVIGAAFIFWLWVNLDGNSLRLGVVWAAIGFVYLLLITRFFRKRPPQFQFTDDVVSVDA